MVTRLDDATDVTLTLSAGGERLFAETRTRAAGEVWRSRVVPSAAGSYRVAVDVSNGPTGSYTWKKERNTPDRLVAETDEERVRLSVGRHTVVPPTQPSHC